MEKERVRLSEPDFLRSIALFGVIAQHILGAYSKRANLGVISMRGIAICFELVRFAVPLFVFLFGMMLARTNTEEFSYPRYLGKRTRQLLIPYILWTIIYQYLFPFVASNDIPSICQLPRMLLEGSGSYHLWYVPMIFQFVILAFVFVPLFERLRTMNKPMVGWTILIGLGLVFLVVLQINPDYSKFLWHYQTRIFLSWLLYFSCGALCGNYYEKFCMAVKKGIPVFAFVSLAMLVWIVNKDFAMIDLNGAVNFNVVGLQQPVCALYLLCFIACLQYIAMLVSSNHTMQKICTFCGKHSYRAYLAHALCITCINYFLYPHFNCYYVYYAVLFIATSASALIIGWGLDTIFDLVRKRIF